MGAKGAVDGPVRADAGTSALEIVRSPVPGEMDRIVSRLEAGGANSEMVAAFRAAWVAGREQLTGEAAVAVPTQTGATVTWDGGASPFRGFSIEATRVTWQRRRHKDGTVSVTLRTVK